MRELLLHRFAPSTSQKREEEAGQMNTSNNHICCAVTHALRSSGCGHAFFKSLSSSHPKSSREPEVHPVHKPTSPAVPLPHWFRCLETSSGRHCLQLPFFFLSLSLHSLTAPPPPSTPSTLCCVQRWSRHTDLATSAKFAISRIGPASCKCHQLGSLPRRLPHN